MKKVFMEAGALYPNLGYLLGDNWKEVNKQFLAEGGDNLSCAIPGCVNLEGINEWHGVYVEPHPANLQSLWTQSKFNEETGRTRRNCYDIFQCCLSGQSKTRFTSLYTTIDFHTIDWGSSVFNPEQPELYQNKIYPISCPSFSLDEFMHELKLRCLLPYLMRLDIEGSEAKLLENYSFWHKPKVLMVECHLTHNETNRDRVEKTLNQQGYQIKHICNRLPTYPEIVAVLEGEK